MGILSVAMALLFAGCIAVEQQPVQFSPVASEQSSLPEHLDKKLDIQLNTGYTRTLKAGSMWTHFGRVAQGEVFKPYHDIFTVEGAHIHEAYLVVANNTLVGFYLPAEQSFSPLSQKISLSFSK